MEPVGTKNLARGAMSDLPDGTFVLTVESGASRGATLEINGASPSRLYLGKSDACDLVIVDPEVSRRHCSVEIVGSALRVTDTGSTNGTWVGDVRIRDANIGSGAVLRLGAVLVSVRHRPDGVNPPVPHADRFGRLLGQSRAMRRLYPLARRLAQSSVPVLIEGETGTGKEMLAESLHEEGPLAAKPFIVFDCTTVGASLVESELFGHARGAFTGADRDRRGVFEQADGGTLFIDEVGDLALPLQAKLLRVVERGEFRRVGGEQLQTVRARIVCATRRDLEREVQAGRFRDDLFHRLAVGRIELPPLRARSGDIPLLAKTFWAQAGGAGEPSAELYARWAEEAWPGNVRELRNAVHRYLAVGEEEPQEGAPPPPARSSSKDFIDAVVEQGLTLAEARGRVVHELEQRFLERLLAEHQGNVSRAAAASGIARRHLQRLRAKSG